MLRQVFFFLSALLLCNNSWTQSRDEYDFYIQKCGSFSHLDLDSLYFYAEKFELTDNQYLNLYGKLQEAKILYFSSKFDSSEIILKDIIFDIESAPRKNSFFSLPSMPFKTYEESMHHLKVNAYGRLFYIKKNQNLYYEAYNALLSRSNCLEQLKSNPKYYFKNKIQVERGIAILKRKLGNHLESLRILMSLYQKLNLVNHEDMGYTQLQYLSIKGNLEVELGHSYLYYSKANPAVIDSADIFFDKSLATVLSYDTNASNLGEHYWSYYMNKINVTFHREDYQAGLAYINKTAPYLHREQQGWELNYLRTICFYRLNEPDSTLLYGMQYVEENRSNQNQKDWMYTVRNILAKTYYDKNELDSAFVYSELARQELQQSGEEIQKTSHRLQKDHLQEFENLNEEILQKKNEAKTTLIIFVLLGSLIITVLVYILFKRKKQSNANYDALYQKYQELKTVKDERPAYSPTKIELKPIKVESVASTTPTAEAETLTKEETKTKVETVVEAPPSKKMELKDQQAIAIMEGLKKIENSRLFLDKEFSLPALAKMLDSNTTYVSKVINDHLGKTFKEYLLELRMELLIHDFEEKPIIRQYSIDALADYTGYAYASSFSRAFKKYTDVSPSKYLKERYG